MSWWPSYFGSEDYLFLEGAPDPGEVERTATFICQTLGLRAGSRVLDVGCGMGRHALALAKRGCLVTAIDGSDYMIDGCRRLASDEPRVIVVQGDFHDMPFEDEFDAVICLGNTLGYGQREDDTLAARRMAAALVPGGAILIELQNPTWYARNAVGRAWWEEDAAFVLSDVSHDPSGRRLVTRDVVIPKDGSPPREYGMSLLHYQADEISGLLLSVGVDEIVLYGDAGADDGGPPWSRDGFSDDSRVIVVTGRKR